MTDQQQGQPSAAEPVPAPEPLPGSSPAPDVANRISAARAQGYSWDDINAYLSDKRSEAKAQGISDDDINKYLGVPTPPEGKNFFSIGDIADHSSRAFIDYSKAAWEGLKTDWVQAQNGTDAGGMGPIQWDASKEPFKSFLDKAEQQFMTRIGMAPAPDATEARDRVPLDIFNTVISPLYGATFGTGFRALSMGAVNVQQSVHSDQNLDQTDMQKEAARIEQQLNFTPALLGIRMKTAPVLSTMDTLDAATAVVNSHDPVAIKNSLGNVATNLHDNWVQTGEQPIAAASRAQNDPAFKEQLMQPPVKEPELAAAPQAKEVVTDPKPVEDGQKINPAFADHTSSTPSLVEPLSDESAAKTAGITARYPVKDLSDLKDIFVKDPVQAGTIAARYVRDTFFPPLASPEAMDASLIMRQNTGEMNRATAITQASFNNLWRSVSNLDQTEKDALVDYMQGRSEGATINPVFRPVADAMREAFQDRAKQMSDLPQFAKIAWKEDYFPQNYKETPAARARWDAMANRQGSLGFTKQREIPSWTEARAYGFEPRYEHPLEAAMNYVRNADRVIAHTQAINDMVEQGVAARFAGDHTDPVPVGWDKLNGALARDYDGNGAVYAPPGVARIYNNAISSGFQGVPGEIWKALNATSNALRQMKLGLFNVYHGFTTVVSSMSREAGMAFGEYATAMKAIKEGDVLAAGNNIAGGTARILSTPIAPIKHFMKGMAALKEYETPGATDAETQNLVDLLTKANSVTHKMPDYMREGAYHDMWDSWQRGDYDNFGQKATAFVNGLTWKSAPIEIPATIAKGVSSFMTTTMRPIFNTLVPRIKTGAAMDAMQQWVEDHPQATQMETTKAAAQIGDSMDNLFGEMMRDNLFWNKKMEQSVNLGFLSYGWVMGELRGTLGGLKDIATLQNTSNAQNVIGFTAAMAMINSVHQYMHTGKAPQDIKDLAFPRTGGTQQAGGQSVDERAVLPGHTSQLAHYYDNFFGEVFGNEANPMFGMAGLLITGKNWAGYDAYNRNGDFFEKSKEFSKAIAQEAEPLMLTNMGYGKKGSNLTEAERFIGVRQAPQFVANPQGVEKQTEGRNAREWGKSQRFEQRQQRSYEDHP